MRRKQSSQSSSRPHHAALRIGGCQTASKITLIYRHLLLRSVRIRFYSRFFSTLLLYVQLVRGWRQIWLNARFGLYPKGIEDTLRFHSFSNTQSWWGMKQNSQKATLYLNSSTIEDTVIIAGNMVLLITLLICIIDIMIHKNVSFIQ